MRLQHALGPVLVQEQLHPDIRQDAVHLPQRLAREASAEHPGEPDALW